MVEVVIASNTPRRDKYQGVFPVQFVCSVDLVREGPSVEIYDCYVDLDEGRYAWIPNFHWWGPDGLQHITSFRRHKDEYRSSPTKELHNFSKEVCETAWWAVFQKEKFVDHGEIGRVREAFKGYV